MKCPECNWETEIIYLNGTFKGCAKCISEYMLMKGYIEVADD